MDTQPTQNPVPSESPRDLKFNAGKIDEFVTSMGWTYTDRFGVQHYTIEGMRWLAQQAISAFGYITLDSFEDGNTLTLPNQVLRLESTGEYYRWDGSFPKVVPEDSTPESTGGTGPGKWLSVGDATLRANLISNDGEKYIGICPDIATLRTTEPSFINQKITVRGYYSDTPAVGGGTFIAFASSEPDDGVNILVTPGGKRWKRTGSHIDIPVENGGMMTSRTAEQNSAAFERLTACLPASGGTLRLNGFYNIKYGAIVPPRVTLEGCGMDSSGLVKTGNDIKTVPDRMWQGVAHSFSKDFITAVDMDSDTAGDLSGTQTRSTRIIGLSLLSTAPNPCDFGIYSAISYNVRLQDLYIHKVKTGYRTSDSWLQSWSNITIQDVVTGVKIDAGGTTYNLNNVYVKTCSGVAYDFNNITYSSLTCLAADFVNGTGYKFKDCTGVNLSGCGSEEGNGKIFDINGSRINVTAFRVVNHHDGGVEAVSLESCFISLTASHFSGYSGTSSSKYIYLNDATADFNGVVIPDNTTDSIRWGSVQSRVNKVDSGGTYSITGNSSWTALCRLESGYITVLSVSPPTSDTTNFPFGTKWELLGQVSTGPWKWTYVSTGEWKVSATTT